MRARNLSNSSDKAAQKVGVTCHAIRKLIRDGILPAKQRVFDAPWQILAVDLERPEVIGPSCEGCRAGGRGWRR